jgi:hypothetical protein
VKSGWGVHRVKTILLAAATSPLENGVHADMRVTRVVVGGYYDQL